MYFFSVYVPSTNDFENSSRLSAMNQRRLISRDDGEREHWATWILNIDIHTFSCDTAAAAAVSGNGIGQYNTKNIAHELFLITECSLIFIAYNSEQDLSSSSWLFKESKKSVQTYTSTYFEPFHRAHWFWPFKGCTAATTTVSIDCDEAGQYLYVRQRAYHVHGVIRLNEIPHICCWFTHWRGQ